MMKKYLLLFAAGVLICATAAYSNYPTKTIKEIQTPTNLTLSDASPFAGDTVWVYGVVADGARYKGGNFMWYTGDRIRFNIMDPRDTSYNFITVVAGTANPGNDTTYFTGLGLDQLVPGDSIRILGYVSEYRSLTQLQVVPVDTCFELLGTSSVAIEPVTRPLSDFYNGTTVTRDPSERDESKFVKFTDLTVIGNNGAEFTVADNNGNQMTVDDQSNVIFAVTPPSVGSKISFVQGYIFTNSNSGWTISPRDTKDYSVAFAPFISNATRLDTFPTSSVTVDIQAKVTSKTSTLTSVKLFYSMDGVEQSPMTMTTSDSIYSATIPAASKDSALVSYYILATNSDGLSSSVPGDTINNRLFYVTHDRPITIQDIQFTPYLDGNPSYVGDKVTVTGIATSDRTIYGAIYVQNGTGPWSAIRILASADSSIRKGDELTVTGWVRESYGLTVLDTATFTINSHNNPLPAPTKVNPADVKTGGSMAEMYESVLLRVDSVFIVNINEDAVSNGNFGEFGVLQDSSKTSGLRVDDYSPLFPYTNDTARFHRPIQLHLHDYFSYIVGPLDYSFSNFKLVPRDSNDFGTYKPLTTVKQVSNLLPNAYTLSQNYPNPFNPSTTIEYSLKSTSPIVLKIYNVIGQEVSTLVNQVQTAGTYRVTFDASRLATGVYFYKLQAGQFTSIKKMMLLK